MLRLSLCSCFVTLCSIDCISQFYLHLWTVNAALNHIWTIFAKSISVCSIICISQIYIQLGTLLSTVFEPYLLSVFLTVLNRIWTIFATSVFLRPPVVTLLNPHQSSLQLHKCSLSSPQRLGEHRSYYHHHHPHHRHHHHHRHKYHHINHYYHVDSYQYHYLGLSLEVKIWHAEHPSVFSY